MFRGLLILLLFAAAGCTQVVSERPLFVAADAAGAAAPRPGVWREVCPPQAETEAGAPRCGGLLAISGTRASEFSEEPSSDPSGRRAGAYQLVAGSPGVVQVKRDGLPRWEYAWLGATQKDRDGRVTRFTLSVVACAIGNPHDVLWNTRGTQDDITDNVAFASSDGAACVADAPEQVRQAADLNRRGQADSQSVTYAFLREDPAINSLVGPWAQPAVAAEPEPVAETPEEIGRTAAEFEWAGGLGAIIAAAAYLLIGLVVGGGWRWVVKPLVALGAASAAIAVFYGPAVLAAQLWMLCLPVIGLMLYDLWAVRDVRQR